MSMSKEPRRIMISSEREDEEKKRNKYTKLYVYDPDFLDGYKSQIIETFASNPELQARVAKNMGDITEVVVGDRVNTGQSRIILAKKQIHLDMGYVDLSEDTFTIKPGNEFIETNFVRTLLYAASRKKGLTGVVEYELDENGKVIGRKNVGLNGGIAQYLAEDITGVKVPLEEDCYGFNKNVVGLLSEVLGLDLIKQAFYEDSSVLKDAMNALAGDPEFYDKFNKDLDTINKLQETVRRMKSGAIKSKNPEEDIARMEAVLKAQQERLVETVFANVIIPQVEKIVVDSLDPLDTKRARQASLLQLLANHNDLLNVVAKYIPEITGSEFTSDEALAAIRQEIKENGIDFSKIIEATRKVDPNKKISQKTATELTGAVGQYYEENQAALSVDRSSELSPFLRRELEKMVVLYDQVKETDENFEGYDKWFRKHFERVPNLDLEMDKIRAERAKKSATPQEEPPEVAMVRNAGNAQGRNEVDESPKKSTTPTEENDLTPDKAKKQEDTTILGRKFVISDLTGQVLDQRNLSLFDKAVNHAIATGEGINPDDDILVEMRRSAAEKYISNLPNKPSKALYAVYGDRWREVLQAAFEEGYRQGMASRLQEATEKGMKTRKETEVKIEKGIPIEEPAREVDFEELQFINEHFTMVPSKTDENAFELVDAQTGKTVLSERTATAYAYSAEWVEAMGIDNEDGKKEAFTEKHAALFNDIQNAIRQNTNEAGEIEIDGVLESLDENHVELAKGFLNDPERLVLISQFATLGEERKEAVVAENPAAEIEASEVEEEKPKRPETPLTDLKQVVEFASEATLEEITPYLDSFGGESFKKADGTEIESFKDPFAAAKLNARYRTLSGVDHPGFVENAPIIIAGFMEQKDELIAQKICTPEDIAQLVRIQKDLESRHPELVAAVSDEKTGHK